MSGKRSALTMFLLAGACVVIAALLVRSMPHGPPPREHDGLITMATMYRYEQQTWKVFSIFGLGIAAPVFLGLGFWRSFRQRKDEHDHGTEA
jgi:hypothetical protein